MAVLSPILTKAQLARKAEFLAPLNSCGAHVPELQRPVAVEAEALGKPTSVMLPFAPDWRWLLNRDDSPWYPTARLFRQSTPGDWEGVLATVTKEIRLRLEREGRGS